MNILVREDVNPTFIHRLKGVKHEQNIQATLLFKKA